MSKVYTIANQKGGCGKTTLTLNLGACLARMGYRVCLCDCDPQANMTWHSAMLVTVLYRLSGEPTVSGGNQFDDVDSGKWYTDAVSWAKANGIVSGVGDNRFAPDAEITRRDLVTMLKRYIDFMGATLPEAPANSGFADDADIANYARDAVEAFFQTGIVKGKPGNVFDPKGNATRAEVTAILHRLVQMAAK